MVIDKNNAYKNMKIEKEIMKKQILKNEKAFIKTV